MRPDVLCRPPAGVATSDPMDDDQLQLFPGVETVSWRDRVAARVRRVRELLAHEEKETALDVADLLHFFRLGWVTKTNWGGVFRKDIELAAAEEPNGFLWDLTEDSGEDQSAPGTLPATVERAWNRLRASMKRLGCPHEDRRSDLKTESLEMRLLPSVQRWLEEVFPSWADESWRDPDDPEDDGTDWSTERLENHFTNTKRDDA